MAGWGGRILGAVLVLGTALGGLAGPVAVADSGTVGTAFPDDFAAFDDASLGVSIIGFGADGAVTRTPVILLHGNNDTPYPTSCNGSFGKIQALAQHLLDHGYAASELWGLGYQGDQCDALLDPSVKSGEAHTTAANVEDLRRFVAAVLDYTGARRVDIVGHSLGATLAREWMRQDRAHAQVRTLVSVDGPHHGIINCSPDPRNYWQAAALGGFTPDSAVCREYGAGNTPFLSALNEPFETPGPTRYVAIVNVDTSFVYFDRQDGTLPPVPAQNRHGEAEDFSRSAWLEGAEVIEVTGQGVHDDTLRTAHLGIINSPDVWSRTLDVLIEGQRDHPEPGRDVRASPATPVSTPPVTHDLPSPSPLPATGPGPWQLVGAVAILAAAMHARRGHDRV